MVRDGDKTMFSVTVGPSKLHKPRGKYTQIKKIKDKKRNVWDVMFFRAHGAFV